MAQLYDLSVRALRPFGEDRFFALHLEHPGWESWNPGQFVMIRPQSWTLDLVWARPLSICRVSEDELILFFQTAGRGTKRLADLRPGDRVHLWGPLGNRFSVQEDGPTLLLAGGIGIAPFVGYADRHPSPERLTLLFGHRPPEECYPVQTLRERIHLEAHRENGPEDLTRFLDLVRQRMEETAAAKGLVLACGPQPFLKAVQGFALACGARTQLSLESRMACGLGACLGCVTRTNEKWPVPEKAGMPVQTCTNGPVFWADQIELD